MSFGFAVIGVLHTIVPDHWGSITLIARQRGWSMTARAALQAGIGPYGYKAHYCVGHLVRWRLRRRPSGFIGETASLARGLGIKLQRRLCRPRPSEVLKQGDQSGLVNQRRRFVQGGNCRGVALSFNAYQELATPIGVRTPRRHLCGRDVILTKHFQLIAQLNMLARPTARLGLRECCHDRFLGRIRERDRDGLSLIQEATFVENLFDPIGPAA